MDNNLQLFENQEFGRLEVLIIGDKPYFPATECAKTLGYRNAQDAVRRHCRGDGCVKHAGVSTTTNQHGVSTPQDVEKTYISEGNLYRLITRSKLSTAARFESWVFDEVLPCIRKHGAYMTEETLKKALQSSEYARKVLEDLWEVQCKKTGMLETNLAELAPKARYYDVILQSKNAVQVSIIAKDYGMSAAAFNRLLHGLRIQYKIGDTWLLYQQYAGLGYTKSRTYYVNEYTSSIHTYWTQKGRFFLYGFLKQNGIAPLMETRDAVCCMVL